MAWQIIMNLRMIFKEHLIVLLLTSVILKVGVTSSGITLTLF